MVFLLIEYATYLYIFGLPIKHKSEDIHHNIMSFMFKF